MPSPMGPSTSRRPSSTTKASEDGRRGAAERECRWLERRLPERTTAERRARRVREDRRILKVTSAIMIGVVGTPRRPRRRPPRPGFLTLLPQALEALQALLDSPDPDVRLRAATCLVFAGNHLWGWGVCSARLDRIQPSPRYVLPTLTSRSKHRRRPVQTCRFHAVAILDRAPHVFFTS
jgi:hypothetical protein